MSTMKVKVKGQDHQVKNRAFRSHCSLTGNEIKVKVTLVKVRGHLGQGQRSLGLRSKATLVKVRQMLKILAGGFTSTSSCIFIQVHLYRGGQIT